ncbi:hypothetical protein [Micromonospora sp. NBC_01412]|uniref:hypothetical protein n=1 Tax=Micromonospora sp. NBC_01412 TaxID=2903590 RepID=UPI0032490D9A
MTTPKGVSDRLWLPIPAAALVVALGGLAGALSGGRVIALGRGRIWLAVRAGSSGEGRSFDDVNRFVLPLKPFDLGHLRPPEIICRLHFSSRSGSDSAICNISQRVLEADIDAVSSGPAGCSE